MKFFFDKLESYILKREIKHNPDLKSFTVQDLIDRIEKSELDYKNGNSISQEDLEKTSANW